MQGKSKIFVLHDSFYASVVSRSCPAHRSVVETSDSIFQLSPNDRFCQSQPIESGVFLVKQQHPVGWFFY